MIMHSPGRRGLTIGTLVLLVACAASPNDRTETASRVATPELAAPVQRDASGVCHARETIPAVYEHVMGEVQVVQAQIAADGTVLHPPIYRRALRIPVRSPLPRSPDPRVHRIGATRLGGPGIFCRKRDRTVGRPNSRRPAQIPVGTRA